MIGLEVCVDTIDGLRQAVAAGVARIELCGPLAVGGTTPPVGLVEAARGSTVPVYAMIRPRDGDFVFSPADEAAMLAEIRFVRMAGLAGVVLGASRADGTLDEAMLARLSMAANGLGRTLHRAFDLAPDPLAALETAIGLGFERVLTSGGAPRAVDGAVVLARLVRAAAGRIEIMAGSGITPDNVDGLVAACGVRAVHASCRSAVPADERLARFGFGGPGVATDGAVVRAMLARLADCPQPAPGGYAPEADRVGE
ncbi:copper homeostasis protein CutC [Lichenicola cladoniae]|uniref:PF03932 family protein CutC n=1 Tax=Lichenicola cladoniae TaxID=1484109 RepID=A0A6M8HPM8_9PROT|nr:copper homeostasis protein CutC [Lichenicola cladoniae]NPD66569.1 copper homeostasis protein CutC [Acetobacteraceae bacterium]QKE90221.1 copper homeostasis protein CutC [Lichenicola cladoniae]